MVLALTMGCTSTGPKVIYNDPQAVQTKSANFSSTDLHLIAEKMVDSILTFPPIVQITQERRPVMYVNDVANKTREHIDTVSITDTISTKILRSGKFRFVDMTKMNEVLKQQEFQASGLVDPDTAIQFGKLIGAEFMLYANLAGIENRHSDGREVYYKFTMRLMNLETGIVEWMDEKEISKSANRRLFGS